MYLEFSKLLAKSIFFFFNFRFEIPLILFLYYEKFWKRLMSRACQSFEEVKNELPIIITYTSVNCKIALQQMSNLRSTDIHSKRIQKRIFVQNSLDNEFGMVLCCIFFYHVALLKPDLDTHTHIRCVDTSCAKNVKQPQIMTRTSAWIDLCVSMILYGGFQVSASNLTSGYVCVCMMLIHFL